MFGLKKIRLEYLVTCIIFKHLFDLFKPCDTNCHMIGKKNYVIWQSEISKALASMTYLVFADKQEGGGRGSTWSQVVI